MFCCCALEAEEGLSGVTGEMVLAVEGIGEGVIGERFVGEVTLREEILSDNEEERSRLAVSPKVGCAGCP